MIRTLQKKFIVTAMVAVTVLLLVLLGAINVFNYLSSSRQSDQLLEQLAALEGFGPAPQGRPEAPDAPGRMADRRGLFLRTPDEDDRRTALGFSVRFNAAGEAESVDLTRIASLTEEEAVSLAQEALAAGQSSGRLGERKYRIVEPAPDCKTVVFLDVSNQRFELLRVAALSALLGLLAWAAMLVLVAALSRRAIRPIAENIERQRQFVTDAGHELKTPLAIILANLDAMELTGQESKYSRNIRSQAARLSGLMQNLLTLARIDENAALPDAAPLSLSELCRESAEMFRAPAELRQIRLCADIADGVTVSGSRTMLQQLLSTLLDNAVKYCPEGGEIGLRLRQEDRTILRVSNTVGQERPDLTRLFDRFYRSDSSRNQQGGFGIGLSAAQAIVRKHKGEIGAHYEDDTIVFTVKL